MTIDEVTIGMEVCISDTREIGRVDDIDFENDLVSVAVPVRLGENVIDIDPGDLEPLNA